MPLGSNLYTGEDQWNDLVGVAAPPDPAAVPPAGAAGGAAGYYAADQAVAPLAPAGTAAPPTQTVSYPTATGSTQPGTGSPSYEAADPAYGQQVPVAAGPPAPVASEYYGGETSAAPIAAEPYNDPNVVQTYYPAAGGDVSLNSVNTGYSTRTAPAFQPTPVAAAPALINTGPPDYSANPTATNMTPLYQQGGSIPPAQTIGGPLRAPSTYYGGADLSMAGSQPGDIRKDVLYPAATSRTPGSGTPLVDPGTPGAAQYYDPDLSGVFPSGATMDSVPDSDRYYDQPQQGGSFWDDISKRWLTQPGAWPETVTPSSEPNLIDTVLGMIPKPAPSIENEMQRYGQQVYEKQMPGQEIATPLMESILSGGRGAVEAADKMRFPSLGGVGVDPALQQAADYLGGILPEPALRTRGEERGLRERAPTDQEPTPSQVPGKVTTAGMADIPFVDDYPVDVPGWDDIRNRFFGGGTQAAPTATAGAEGTGQAVTTGPGVASGTAPIGRLHPDGSITPPDIGAGGEIGPGTYPTDPQSQLIFRLAPGSDRAEAAWANPESFRTASDESVNGMTGVDPITQEEANALVTAGFIQQNVADGIAGKSGLIPVEWADTVAAVEGERDTHLGPAGGKGTGKVTTDIDNSANVSTSGSSGSSGGSGGRSSGGSSGGRSSGGYSGGRSYGGGGGYSGGGYSGGGDYDGGSVWDNPVFARFFQTLSQSNPDWMQAIMEMGRSDGGGFGGMGGGFSSRSRSGRSSSRKRGRFSGRTSKTRSGKSSTRPSATANGKTVTSQPGKTRKRD